MKKIIFIIATIFIVVLSLVFVYVSTKNENKEGKRVVITEKGIIKEEKFHGLELVDISLIGEDGTYTFSLGVLNNTSEIIDVTDLDIVIKDKNEKEISRLPVHLERKIPPWDKVLVEVVTTVDLRKAYTKEIVERKTDNSE